MNGKTRLHPIAYASASFKPSEKSYAQVDREGLAIIWAVRYFRQYLWCQNFELHTDCSALVKIFGPKNDLGGCATGRLNRWAALLMEYTFTIKHIKGSSNYTADNLSRLPVCKSGSNQASYPGGGVTQLAALPTLKKIEFFCEEEQLMAEVQNLAYCPQEDIASVTVAQVIGQTHIEAWDIIPLSLEDVARKTREDKQYGKLYRALESGVLDEKDPDLKRFNGIFNELYIENGVIYFGTRVVIPTCQHARLLEELHFSHIGIVRMKYTVRRYFWWPGITKDIEAIAAKCEGCRRYRKRPAPSPLCPWPYSRRPMERVHVDFCEYEKRMILVMIDSFSKKIWLQNMMNDTTTQKTLAILYGWFCQENGFPTTLVSDNGPQFGANEFKEKMTKWDIKHLLIPPYHPASNGLAEKAVGIVKDRLKKMNVSARPIQLHTALKYIERVNGLTPHTSTGRCPYELVKQGPVPSLFPKLTGSSRQQARSEKTAVQHSSGRLHRRRTFEENEEVIVYDVKSKLSSKGRICEVLGNNTYLADVGDGPRHVSGDCISKISASAGRNIGGAQVEEDLETIGVSDDEADSVSIVSESSIGSAIFDNVAPQANNQRVRRAKRTQVELLGSPVANLPRLRPRNR